MILCITHSGDFYTIDIVQQQLRSAGYAVFRFNTDEFAENYRLNYTLQQDVNDYCLLCNGQKILASQIQAVWYRKLWKFKIPPGLDPNYHDIFLKEYHTCLHIFFNSLQHIPWINKMQSDHAVCNDKLHQLAMAQAAGLKVPATIFTNDKAVIQEFFEQCRGDMVVKLHGALSKSMEGNTPFFPTTRLSKEDLEHLDSLAYCPMIFQEFIPKAYELRIAWVDGEFFAGQIAVDADLYTDWRMARSQTSPWKPYTLPAAIQHQVNRLMVSLDLSFGVLDMIRHRDGDYIFLEVNPQGEWGMLQKDLHYPIGETIANKLITRINND